MGIRDLFKKKNTKTTSFDEQLRAGLITYDEAQDDNAAEIVKSFLFYLQGRKRADNMIINASADAAVVNDTLKIQIERGAGMSELLEMTYNTNRSFNTPDSIRRYNHTVNLGSLKHGSVMLECARATSEIAGKGKELDLYDLADRCMKPEVIKRAEDGLISQMPAGYVFPEFNREDIQGFIGMIIILNEDVDAHRDPFNENLYLVDEEGLVEPDNLKNFKSYDEAVFDKARKTSRRNYSDLVREHFYSDEDMLGMMSDDICVGVKRLAELTKASKEGESYFDIVYQRALRRGYLKNDRYSYNALKEGYPEITRDELIKACEEKGLQREDTLMYLELLDEFTRKNESFIGEDLQIAGID